MTLQSETIEELRLAKIWIKGNELMLSEGKTETIIFSMVKRDVNFNNKKKCKIIKNSIGFFIFLE